MKTVCEKNRCAGCMACVDICPKSAITIADELYAYNAVIDEDKCVACNLCHQICQQNQEPELTSPIAWYQGWSADPAIRSRGSSGGVATALALSFVANGGMVCCCLFENGEFRFQLATTPEDVLRSSGSKYVKSNPQGCYQKVKQLLKDNKKVLFIGLPCQVAAMKQYAGSKYADQLFTVDLICHGTPSPQLLKQFLKESKYSIDSIKDIRFRKKVTFQLAVSEKPIMGKGLKDAYTLAFINGLTYTENCYTCRYARKERAADITLGDSWGSEIHIEEQYKGISLILCQTPKGVALAENSGLHLLPVDLNSAIQGNDQLQHPSEKPNCQRRFFKGITAGRRFITMVARCYPKQYAKLQVKRFLQSIRKP